MNKLSWLGLAASMTLACGSTDSDEAGAGDRGLAIDAQFVSFRWSSASLLCGGTASCSSSFEIRADGEILKDGVPSGRSAGAEDMAGFAALATGREFVEAVRAGTDCYIIADGSTRIELGIAPGLFVIGSADCGGVVGEVVDAAQMLTNGSTQLTWPPAPVRARIDEPAVFLGLELQHDELNCPAGQSCAVGLSIGADGFIHRGSSDRVLLPEAELANFAALAVSDAVLSALMAQEPCPPSSETSDRLLLSVGEGLRARGEIAGCEAGPLAELRAAATDLADRYTTSP